MTLRQDWVKCQVPDQGFLDAHWHNEVLNADVYRLADGSIEWCNPYGSGSAVNVTHGMRSAEQGPRNAEE